MPLYEYVCKKCGASFEVLLAQSDQPVKCSFCGAENAERQLSVFSTSVSSGYPAACGSQVACGGACQSSGACPFTR